MFKEDNLIIKIYGSDRFFAVREAFSIGKVKLEFRIYDKNKGAGEKIRQSVDIYMNIDKFATFCQYLKDGRMEMMLDAADRKLDYEIVSELINVTKPDVAKMLSLYGVPSVALMDAASLKDLKGKLIKKLARQGGDANSYMNRTPPAVFEDYGGRSSDQGVFSRVFNVIAGSKQPILLKASEGPGRKGDKGQIIPVYKSWNQNTSKSIQIPLSSESATTVGLAGLRAIAIYDMWASSGLLEKRLERIHPTRNDGHAAGNSRSASSGGFVSQSGQGSAGLTSPAETGQFRSAREPQSDGGAVYREMDTSVKNFGNRQVLW